MNKITFLSIGFVFCFFTVVMQSKAQETSLGKKITDLSYSWDLEADDLNNYIGLQKFCASAEYRQGIITLLNDLHHYDSLLYDRLIKASRFKKDREVEKTIAEIEEFETEYDMNSFLNFLRKECMRVKEIEHEADELKKDIGENSYDGQVYRVETELNKYIKHITKRVDHIREHINHLHIN